MSLTKRIPVVFISSTVEDLEPYRAQARDAAIRAGFYPVMQEYFVARDHPPLKECMERVAQADVVVAVVAHRYGWVPLDQRRPEAKSITWLECEKAASDGKDILAFVVDEKCDWPAERRESYRATAAIEDGKATTELLAEVQRNVAQLREFKQWLGTRTRRAFSSIEGLKAEVEAALGDWLKRHPEFAEPSRPQAVDDPHKYLEGLREHTAWIDIRGLLVGTQKLHRFSIEELYIPLTAAGRSGETERELRGAGKMRDREAAPAPPMELQETLAQPRLVIVGDPGSGKTTFLKRIAFALATVALKKDQDAVAPPLASDHHPAAPDQEKTSFWGRLAAAFRQTEKIQSKKGKSHAGKGAGDRPEQPFPVLIRIADLAEHVRKCLERPGYPGPTAPHAPSWIWDFLNAQNQAMNWGLSEGFFRQHLEAGSVILLLDGLDEAPSRIERQSMARLFEQATRAYPGCRFVVTTRPLSYSGEATLAGFELAQIEPLGQGSIEKFLEQWCRQVSPDSPNQAKLHLAELLEALRNRVEIRRMAHNPVMLTALAVVHWNERRLPEGRAELYRSILRWLAQTREQRTGREPADRCLTLLQHLALAMQDRDSLPGHESQREVQVSRRQAAEILESQFSGAAEKQRLENALAFLDQEEVDSGIIVSRGNEIRFWHLTFQEYLAARAIAGQPDSDQHQLLLATSKILRPEWREVVLLFAGVLMEQGRAKVDALISAVLNRLGDRPKLSEQAQGVGLIGAMVRDLHPLGYQPADPRYQSALEAVLGIFDEKKASGIELQVRLEAAEALGQAGDPRLRPGQQNWITIPACSFLMGAQKQDSTQPNYDPEAFEEESPVHEVRLAAYQVSRYPVTVEEYRRFMNDDGYQNKAWWKGGGFGERNQPDEWDDQLLHLNRPVASVTWYEAAAWCAWARVRLPTEAEWERAARGANGWKYPWGNQEPDPERANYDQTKLNRPIPVGLFPRGMTPEGIHDLAGNVWEWVEDWYDERYYAKSPSANPTGPTSGKGRVVRGGSWNFVSRFLRSSYRDRNQPVVRYVNIGFRCAREVFP
jgi:formylglycine-generating enzyme required for sulfatase activity